MGRERFLQVWGGSYPQAPDGCWSVRRFVRRWQADGIGVGAESCWIGGELGYLGSDDFEQGRFFLSGQGERVFFDIGGSTCSMNFSGQTWSMSEVLLAGDFVSIEVQRGSIKRRQEFLTVEKGIRVELLTPALLERGINRFSYAVGDLWASYLARVRRFFVEEEFTEVNTPSLVPCPGVEPELIPFSTEFRLGSYSETMFLPTSPEIHLKKLLMQGWTEVFEIKRCYRNEEVSEHHEPEFLMLEWYRAFSGLTNIQDDVICLIKALDESGFVKGEVGTVRVRSMSELFQEYLQFELKPETKIEELQAQLIESKLPFDKSDDWDDLFHLLFLVKIEPNLGLGGPDIIKDYPPSQAALARLNERGWADRFEIYWRGLEIGNAFHELNDPFEQEERWHKDLAERERKGRPKVFLDKDFLIGMKSGMPPAGGIAVGLERLFMACQNELELKNIKAFPYIERLER